MRYMLRPGARTGAAFSEGLGQLRAGGLAPVGRFRSLGSGKGEPLTASHTLTAAGLEFEFEVLVGGGVREAAFTAPGWTELQQALDEDSWWNLVDRLAAAVGARFGALGDGEALAPELPSSASGWNVLMWRHMGILVPRLLEPDLQMAQLYRMLPQSHLQLFLR